MEEFTLKVKTEVLVAVSADLEAKVARAHSTFQEIESIINRTVSYWEGDGQRQMAAGYNKRSDDFNRVFDGIRDHARKLNEMVGIYEMTENFAEAVADILPGDVIS